jgi:hypothetical protein
MENINIDKIEELRKVRKGFYEELEMLSLKWLNTRDESKTEYDKLLKLDTYCPNLIRKSNKSYGAKLGQITRKIKKIEFEIGILTSMIDGMINGAWLFN